MSKRLGYKNKALLKVGNKSIIEHIIDALSVVTESILLIANSPEEFEHFAVPIYSDIIHGSGPLGGIYTGLQKSMTHYNLVIACDMPFIQPYVLESLINQIEGYDIVIPFTPDGYHPLCAIYSKKCITPIELLINSGRLKVTNLFHYVKVNKIDFSSSSESELNTFFNINTDEDYLLAISLVDTYNNALQAIHNT